MEAIKEALTFDDVLLLPRFSKFLPSIIIFEFFIILFRLLNTVE